MPAAAPVPEGGATPRAFLVGLVAAAGLLAFVGMRPSQPWLLFFTAGAVALAAAGTVRAGARGQSLGDLAPLGFSLLPATCTLAAGAFADQMATGYLRAWIAGGAGLAVGGVVLAEVRSVERRARVAGPSRLLLAGAAYGAAFGLFTVMFQDRVRLVPGVIATGLAAWLLATSLLSGRGSVGRSALLAGLAVGLSLSELRAALYYFPLEGVAGGVTLLVGFHVATGIVHHLLDRDLSWSLVGEYALSAGLALVAITVASAAG
ncbi:MAG: hypothetical protein ACE5EF_10670 [Dehalococcoidia bacterium]